LKVINAIIIIIIIGHIHWCRDNLWHLWRSQNVTISKLWPGLFLWISPSFAKQIWSHFVHKCHKWSHILMWLVQPCFCFCHLENYLEWMESSKTYQKVSFVFVICLESGSERLWLVGSSNPRKKERKTARPNPRFMFAAWMLDQT